MREFASDSDFNRSSGVNTSETNYPDNMMGFFRRRLHRTVVGDGYNAFEIGGRHYSGSDEQRRFFAPFF